MMKKGFGRTKIFLLIVLGTLFAADAAMTFYSIRVASSNLTPQHQLATQIARVRLLRADVKRAREIQNAVPKTKADCGLFEESLPPVGAGYSVISGELQDLSQKAGLQVASLSFHPKDFTSHGITEVSLDASISGDYKSVVRFLNGLQHSKNHYVVDDLTLANEQAGLGSRAAVKVNLHIRSYFKAVA
jgi:type IV pilus assembly protein PilO